MSSDQHFSPPRFCFTLLITGSPLTTDKNYSSKTCGRCARRALYNVRYNPPPPHHQGPLAKQLHFFHGFDCPCDSSPALDNIIILSCTKERMSRAASVCASSVFYTRGAAPSVSVKRLKNVCFSDDPESDVIV